MPLVLALLLAVSPSAPSTELPVSSPGASIRARAWKVTLTGGIIVAVGVGFLVTGRVLEGLDSPDPVIANTGRAFTVGGVMLAVSGALVGLLSIPLWTWVDARGNEVISLAPLGASLRW